MSMEKEKLESMLIDYIDGRLDATQKQEVEALLAADAEARLLYNQLKEVTQAMNQSPDIESGRPMKARFLDMLGEEIQQNRKGRQVFFQPSVLRIAAAVALVLSGVAIGFWVNKSQQHDMEIAALKKQMEATKQMMMAMIENPQSASKRMQGVNVALTIESADNDVVNALVKTMNEDPNSNVRLAALEALSKFQHEPIVRSSLIRSLGTQEDPVVQIALIQLLVKMKEKGVVNGLNNIINDSTSIQAVKDEAHTGILRLS
jgi:flagellar basal body-associated protein FliL